jgi:hypothetical protein
MKIAKLLTTPILSRHSSSQPSVPIYFVLLITLTVLAHA